MAPAATQRAAAGFEYAVAEECRSVDVSFYSVRIDPFVACDNATGDPVDDSGVLRPRSLYAGFEDFTTIDMPVQTVSPPRSLRLLTCDDPNLKKV
ncbi:hypothetical protein PINS_up017098 [Pythium insidiosum]|nr:hypothetical protein PINS_up017098 [Pythium insidiosum]